MKSVDDIVDEVTQMGLKTDEEAKDMVVSLYGFMPKSILADVFIKLEEYYVGK